ncbi:MAG: flagellar hook-basal body complex protein FliE [Candidatus Thermoplasmatota archaeon]|jgi:dephospho-CoA kinase|nr:flagellar hook-basal body complex protein FliE [Candidatus Thermoplasmatota archaeon]MCL5962966.1 flagellar hook-basal body complex protein FliE [Candidatus Thermoplasmatota archaeon]
MKIIIVVGMPGSGKDEFLKISKKFGLEVIKMGDVIRNEMIKRNLQITPEQLPKFASEEREKNGMGIWAKRTIPYLTEKNSVIEGIRGDAELNIFKHNFGGNLDIVCIFSTPKTRYDRMKKRERRDDPSKIDDFVDRDQRELRYGIGNVIAMSDYIIVNEGTLDDMEKASERLIRNIIMDVE